MSDVQSLKQKISMQQWSAIIKDRNASGLKIEEYCEKNGLSRNAYFYWLRKIREEIALSTSPQGNDLLPTTVKQGALVELVPSSGCNPTVPKIEISSDEQERTTLVMNGINIAVDSNISERMLTKIMRAVRNA